jgi:4-amino-4-deoxy-L-arabinose transferase-like glycosyltransferase
MGLATIWLTFRTAKLLETERTAIRACLILATIPVFYISIGAVMTDPALMFGTTLAMTGFAHALRETSSARNWGYLFFTGLAVGVLAKGPVAIILTGVPIFFWTLWNKKWLELWRHLPWVTGTCLFLVISIPWFFLAEQKTPGFLDYFIIGEHWKRFTEPGWSGDLYGGGHERTKGTIWVYFFLTTLPWSLVLLSKLRNKLSRLHLKSLWGRDRTWNSYLLCWTVAPLLFFTMSSNILWTYVLTGIPAFSILIGSVYRSFSSETITPHGSQGKIHRTFQRTATSMMILYLLLLVPMSLPVVSNQISQKNLIADYKKMQNNTGGELIYIFGKPYSADFYSGGQALLVKDKPEFEDFLNEPGKDYFATKRLYRIPKHLIDSMKFLRRYGEYYLFREL